MKRITVVLLILPKRFQYTNFPVAYRYIQLARLVFLWIFSIVCISNQLGIFRFANPVREPECFEDLSRFCRQIRTSQHGYLLKICQMLGLDCSRCTCFCSPCSFWVDGKPGGLIQFRF